MLQPFYRLRIRQPMLGGQLVEQACFNRISAMAVLAHQRCRRGDLAVLARAVLDRATGGEGRPPLVDALIVRGVLAALGVGSFFTGKNALDISVNQSIKDSAATQAAVLGAQTKMNNQSAVFNTLMANKDAEKKAFEKIHG